MSFIVWAPVFDYNWENTAAQGGVANQPVIEGESFSDENNNTIAYQLYSVFGSYYGEISASQRDSHVARQLEQRAVEEQVREFRAASQALERRDGFYFYISDGERYLTNAPRRDADFFRSYPVYIIDSADLWELSAQRDGRRDWGFFQPTERTAYIAFTNEAVDPQTPYG